MTTTIMITDRSRLAATMTASWMTFAQLVMLHVNVIVGTEYDNDSEEACGKPCTYGCCGEQDCCDPPEATPGYSVQVIAVVGAFLITLLLLLLCFVRYRCVSRLRRQASHFRNDVGRRRSAARVSSVFSLDVPSGMSSAELEQRTLANTEGQLVLPPPYSEQDPLSSLHITNEQVSGSSTRDVEAGDLPPAYADVVKDSVFVTTPEEGDN